MWLTYRKKKKSAQRIVWTDDQSGFRDLLRMNVERFNHLLQLVPPYIFLNKTPNGDEQSVPERDAVHYSQIFSRR